MPNVFSVPIFLIVLRETLEASIVVSVLLAFVHKSFNEDGTSSVNSSVDGQNTPDSSPENFTDKSTDNSPDKSTDDSPVSETLKEASTLDLVTESAITTNNTASSQDMIKLKKRLLRQIWFGASTGFFLCLCIGGAFIGVFYGLEKDIWSKSEEIWEGTFALIATLMITFVGAAMLRVSKLQGKWQRKLNDVMLSCSKKHKDGFLVHNTKKYSMFIIPFITVLREGLEAVVFVGGVGISQEAISFPLPVVVGIIVGILIGYLIYKGGSLLQLQYFLIVSTCVLYLIAAGLFSKAVGYFEQYKWNKLVGGDVAELGSGLGTYDFRKAIWHVNYGNPELKNTEGWGIFNAILGWNNTGTFGTVLSYIFYWWFVAIAFFIGQRCEQNPNSRMSKTLGYIRRRLSWRFWYCKMRPTKT